MWSQRRGWAGCPPTERGGGTTPYDVGVLVAAPRRLFNLPSPPLTPSSLATYPPFPPRPGGRAAAARAAAGGHRGDGGAARELTTILYKSWATVQQLAADKARHRRGLARKAPPPEEPLRCAGLYDA